ncbi:DUF2490 domain-containing protein [Christiangramia flava]|uniref:Uncharacterized protein n=1 Tax=Christiangramia flava JLT2011 TaxID=1229726 RepID=A0A1L7I3T7_9FLAO|nr:DUF2490 domain-containing protein [Christiangramia flava]APU67864.1 hypothetical protein GRFL_1140 [Christiangramia flava JLT2011]OSS40366.1 hypothetical protein C723_0674 [Christiangramia flava JLT2011]
MTTSFFKFLFFGICLVFISFPMRAQDAFSAFLEPEISINWNRPNRWSFNFAFGNRDILHERQETQFSVQHLELTHFTSYEVGFYGKLSLGLRYRFREMFDNANHNEVRIIQQYARERSFNRVAVAHRFRLEERFRDRTTFRNRYRFSVEFPLNGDRVNRNEFFLVTETEALWSLGKQEKPSLEQRFGVSLGRAISKDAKLELGTEYRLNDYMKETAGELFISTQLSISI